jgi:hypothetical protein
LFFFVNENPDKGSIRPHYGADAGGGGGRGGGVCSSSGKIRSSI